VESLWLQCVRRRPEAVRRLVCFPHAGGSASFFREWADRLPGTEIHAVRYPGRAERIDEPCATDLCQLAADIAQAVASSLADLPVALFGHSMGAAVALETARQLENAGFALLHLIASGSRDGELPPPQSRSHADDEDPDSVVEELVRLGGTDPELAADPIFRELVVPYVIADTRMFHAHRMSAEPVLRCPVTTIAGDCDSDSDLRPWRRLTTGALREASVAGGHFYLVDDPPLALLTQILTVTAREETRH